MTSLYAIYDGLSGTLLNSPSIREHKVKMNLVYLTTCFGTPSHTFIRREIREFQDRGIDIQLFGIRKDSTLAPDASDMIEKTQYLYPIRTVSTLAAHVYFLFSHPKPYFTALRMALAKENGGARKRLKLSYHFFVAAAFARSFLRHQVTHIHAHFLHVPSSISMFASVLSGIPFSITVHSAGERALPHVDAIPQKLRYAQQLLMISKFNIDYYNAIEPCASRSHVVRCGMQIEDFSQRPFVPQKSCPLKVLAVGRFVEKKGFAYLVDAARILRDEGHPIHVEIVGSGPLYDTIQRQCRDAELEEYVLLSGHAPTESVRKKMMAADIVVVPSVTSRSGEMEGIPVVLMEAMASGVPVIASAHSGIPELVNESTGILTAERNAEALATVLKDFSPNERTVKNARALIENQFNIHKVVDQRHQLFS